MDLCHKAAISSRETKVISVLPVARHSQVFHCEVEGRKRKLASLYSLSGQYGRGVNKVHNKRPLQEGSERAKGLWALAIFKMGNTHGFINIALTLCLKPCCLWEVHGKVSLLAEASFLWYLVCRKGKRPYMTLTVKVRKPWTPKKISGMLIVYWPFTIKFRIRKQNSKPQTYYLVVSVLVVSYLIGWLLETQ